MSTTVDTTWLAQVELRIAINEGRELTRYRDSLGVYTLGVGFNLERGDAPSVLRSCGIDYVHVMSNGAITDAQCDALFRACLAPIEDAARGSLAPGVYDALSDARRFVICDLEYNLGQSGWFGFAASRALINQAQASKTAGHLASAHAMFELCADHLAASAWAGQVGDRARRNIAMIRNGVWVSPTGDGSV